MPPDGLSIGYTQPTFATRQGAIEQAVERLIQHPQHLRIKKLLFSVCYGTWENEPTTLDSVSIGSLVTILLGRYSTLSQCRDSLHRKANSLNRRKVYSAIANVTLYYLRDVFDPQVPFSPSTDQQAANLSASVQSLAKSKLYQSVVDAISTSSNLEMIQTFLGYLGQAPGTIADTTSTDLLSLVQNAHRQSPTPLELKQHLMAILKYQTSPIQSQGVMKEILRAFRPLYISAKTPPVVTSPDSLTTLEQELAQKCDVHQVRVLLYSILYGPYADSPLQREMLRIKTLRDLLQETFDYCPTYGDFESKLTILAHCLETSDGINRALKVMLVSLYGYYTKDKRKSDRSSDRR
ncbi:hypothetical protein [Leptothoe sp. PORK10 BA2]|uniref:hypothetical protein n=1 Tax=Leptothoe sp. PORK10 BA2 TaxID=3110254 RepID=UPI002B1FC7E0|nr:hypothetical protein [Leptothoe sp. PORK10 BA2]MEA5463579.1 hypothetical protein [Leptothoe sp. PORK10 BA2]